MKRPVIGLLHIHRQLAEVFVYARFGVVELKRKMITK